MVTLTKYSAISGGEIYNRNVLWIEQLSPETKPTGTFIEYDDNGKEVAKMPIQNGSILSEIDTGKTYKYDEANSTWYEFAVGGSGGDAYTKAETDALLADKADLDTDGLIPLNQIPPAAMEHMVSVANDTARFALTTDDVQNGDTVYVESSALMYMVVDDEELDNESGYLSYAAGTASRAIADKNGDDITTTYQKTILGSWTAGQSTTHSTPAGTDTVLEALQKIDNNQRNDETNILLKANTSDVNTATANLQTQINQIEIGASAEAVVAPEVIAARVDADGISHDTLKQRLDSDAEKTEAISEKFYKEPDAIVRLDGFMRGDTGAIATTGKRIELSVVAGETIKVFYASGHSTYSANTLLFINGQGEIIEKYPTSSPYDILNYDAVIPSGCTKLVINDRYENAVFSRDNGVQISKITYNNLSNELNGAFIEIADSIEADYTTQNNTRANNAVIGTIFTSHSSNGYTLASMSVSEGEKYQISCHFTGNASRTVVFTTSDDRVVKKGEKETYYNDIVTVPLYAHKIYVSSSKPLSIRKVIAYKPKHNYSSYKWAVVGDSLTDTSINAKHKYEVILNEQTGIQVQMLGVGGTGWWREYSTESSYSHRAAEIDSDTDIITFFGSINDWIAGTSGVPNGEPSDTLEDETLSGYINHAIDVAEESAPYARIVIFSAMWYQGINKTRQEELYNTLKAVAEYRDIEFVDMLHGTGFTRISEELYGTRYAFDYSTTAEAFGHPSDYAHERIIAPRFYEILKKNLPIV